MKYAKHLDVLAALVGLFLSVFIHEFGHLFTAIGLGDKPSLIFGQGYIGPALLVFININYEWEYWIVARLPNADWSDKEAHSVT